MEKRSSELSSAGIVGPYLDAPKPHSHPANSRRSITIQKNLRLALYI